MGAITIAIRNKLTLIRMANSKASLITMNMLYLCVDILMLQVVTDRAVTRSALVRTTVRARILVSVSALADGTATCAMSPAPTVSSARAALNRVLLASSVIRTFTFISHTHTHTFIYINIY